MVKQDKFELFSHPVMIFCLLLQTSLDIEIISPSIGEEIYDVKIETMGYYQHFEMPSYNVMTIDDDILVTGEHAQVDITCNGVLIAQYEFELEETNYIFLNTDEVENGAPPPPRPAPRPQPPRPQPPKPQPPRPQPPKPQPPKPQPPKPQPPKPNVTPQPKPNKTPPTNNTTKPKNDTSRCQKFPNAAGCKPNTNKTNTTKNNTSNKTDCKSKPNSPGCNKSKDQERCKKFANAAGCKDGKPDDKQPGGGDSGSGSGSTGQQPPQDPQPGSDPQPSPDPQPEPQPNPDPKPDPENTDPKPSGIKIQVRVIDYQTKAPVAEANVELSLTGTKFHTAQSDAAGSVKLQNEDVRTGDEITVTVTSTRYKIESSTLTLEEGYNNITIQLRK